jgi:hypothetical protein
MGRLLLRCTPQELMRQNRAFLERFDGSREGDKVGPGDHGAGISLVDCLPETRAQLAAALSGVNRRCGWPAHAS